MTSYSEPNAILRTNESCHDTSDSLGGQTNESFTEYQIQDLHHSGISPIHAKQAGLRNISDSKEMGTILNWGMEGPTPGLGIPYFKLGDMNNPPILLRVKLDTPRKTSDGYEIKYEHPRGEQPRLYIPPIIPSAALFDRSKPILVTEGEQKALSGAVNGFVTIAVPGIFHFGYSSADAEKLLKAEFMDIPLKGRVVFLAFDSQKFEKRKALQNELLVANILNKFDADVRLMHLTHFEVGHD